MTIPTGRGVRPHPRTELQLQETHSMSVDSNKTTLHYFKVILYHGYNTSLSALK